MKVARGILGMALVLALSGWSALAQSEPAATTPAKPEPNTVLQTFYLNNVSQQSDAIEALTVLRNMLDPRVKIYPVTNQNAIMIRATPDQLALAQKLLNDLDRPKRTYRLTYTMTEMDSGKRIGVQHFAMIVVAGQRTLLKQGSKVPVSTGSPHSDGSAPQNQVQYLDVGMNFDAQLDESMNGVRLRSKVEQSSVAEERSGLGLQDPVIRQTMLEGTSFLTAGKPLMLGSVDVPGSTRHYDVEVVMELVK